MNATLINWAGRTVGLALIIVVLWLVGWQDSVTTPDGETIHGTILEVVMARRLQLGWWTRSPGASSGR